MRATSAGVGVIFRDPGWRSTLSAVNVTGQGPDLEVLLDGSTTAGMADASRPTRPRRWRVGAIVLTALILGWMAFPLRSALARSVVRQLEGHWLKAEAADQGRFAVSVQLTAAAAPGDEARVRAGTASLYRDEVSRLKSIRRDLHAELVADPPLSKVRAAMIHAAAGQADDLDRVANWYSTSPVPFGLPPRDRSLTTVVAIDRANVLLDAELRRVGLRPRRPPELPRYRSADQILAALNRIADGPTGTTIVVSSRAGPLLVDIDANRINPAAPAAAVTLFGSSTVIVRRGYVVLGGANANEAAEWAIPQDLQGPPRLLGDAVEAVPAVDPSGVWLHRLDGSVIEVDAQVHVLAGPATLPAGSFLRAAIDAGLVLVSSDGHTVSVWNPASGTTVRTITTQSAGQPAAAMGDTVVWWQDTTIPSVTVGSNLVQIVHLTTVSTGRDRRVVTPASSQPCGAGWSISPDGTKVASTWCVNSPTSDFAYAPGIIDLASGRLNLGPVTASTPEPSRIDWSPRGDRIFITNSPDLLTYHLGSATVEHLRLHHLEVLASAVVAT